MDDACLPARQGKWMMEIPSSETYRHSRIYSYF